MFVIDTISIKARGTLVSGTWILIPYIQGCFSFSASKGNAFFTNKVWWKLPLWK